MPSVFRTPLQRAPRAPANYSPAAVPEDNEEDATPAQQAATTTPTGTTGGAIPQQGGEWWHAQPAPIQWAGDPQERTRQAMAETDRRLEAHFKEQNPFRTEFDKVATPAEYYRHGLAQANEEYAYQQQQRRQAAVAQRQAAALDTAGYNSKVKADSEKTGKMVYTDPLTKRLTYKTDEQGRQIYNEIPRFMSTHPKTGEPAYESRDRYGQRQFAPLPIQLSTDPMDEHGYYYDKSTETLTQGPHYTEMLKSQNPVVQRQGIALKRRLDGEVAKTTIADAEGNLARISTDYKATQDKANTLLSRAEQLRLSGGDPQEAKRMEDEAAGLQEATKGHTGIGLQKRMAEADLMVQKAKLTRDQYLYNRDEIGILGGRGKPHDTDNETRLKAAEDTYQNALKMRAGVNVLNKPPAVAGQPVEEPNAAGVSSIGGVGTDEFARRYGDGSTPASPANLLKLYQRSKDIAATLGDKRTSANTQLRDSLRNEKTYIDQLASQRLAALPADQQKRVIETSRDPTFWDTVKGGVKSLGEGAAQAGSEVLKGAAVVSQAVAPNVPLPLSQRVELAKEGAPFKLGQFISDAAKETYSKGAHEEETTTQKAINSALEAAGGFAPLVASGPGAPATIGLQSAGADLEKNYQAALDRGMTHEQASDFATKRALAGGAAQAAIFEFLPPAFKGVLDKGIVDKVVGGGFKKFLANRAAQGVEGAALGTASAVAGNAAADRPLTEGVTEAGTGLGVMQALMPRGASARPVDEAATPSKNFPVTDKPAGGAAAPATDAEFDAAIEKDATLSPEEKAHLRELLAQSEPIPANGLEGTQTPQPAPARNAEDVANIFERNPPQVVDEPAPIKSAAESATVLANGGEPPIEGAAPGGTPEELATVAAGRKDARTERIAEQMVGGPSPELSQTIPPEVQAALEKSDLTPAEKEHFAQLHGESEPAAPAERISQAAIKTPDGKVHVGRTHGFIASELPTHYDMNKATQGFTTSEGRFVDRDEAMAIAKESGQKGAFDKGAKKLETFHMREPAPIGPRDASVSTGNGVPTPKEEVMLKEQRRLIEEHNAEQVTRADANAELTHAPADVIGGESKKGGGAQKIHPQDTRVGGAEKTTLKMILEEAADDRGHGDENLAAAAQDMIQEARKTKDPIEMRRVLSRAEQDSIHAELERRAKEYESDADAVDVSEPTQKQLPAPSTKESRTREVKAKREAMKATEPEPSASEPTTRPISAEQRINNADLGMKPVSALTRAEKRAELDAAGIKTYNGKPLDDANPAEISNAVGKLRRGELTAEGEKPGKLDQAISRLDAEIKKYSGEGKGKMDPRSEKGASDLHTAAYVSALKVARVILKAGRSVAEAVEFAIKRYRALNPKHTSDELKAAEKDVRAALTEPEPPKPAAPKATPKAKPADTTGIAHRVTEARGSAAERGAGISPEDSIAHGRDLLKKGYDPEQAVKDFSEKKAISADAVAAARAHAEELSRASNKAADDFGTDSPQYKAAWSAEKKWIEAIKPMQTEWHKIGQAQQGETEIDTGTFHGLKKAFFESTGRDMTPDQEKVARKLSTDVKKATTEAEGEKEKIIKTFADSRKATQESIKQARELVTAHKEGAEWTADEAKALWHLAKANYLDKGVNDFNAIRAGLATDYGLSKPEIAAGLATPKGAKAMTDAMYAKMSERRRVVDLAKQWIKDAKYPGWLNFARSVPPFFFNLATFGHGTVGMITHAGNQMFNPGAVADYWKNFGKQFKLMGWHDSGAYHEQAMQDLIRDPNYIKARRAGLANDPFRFQDDYQNAQVIKQFKAIGLAGNRGFDALKLFRQDRFNRYWDALPASLKTPDMAKLLADNINHATGVTRSSVGSKAANWVLFAPKLEASRWQALIGDPAKAAKTIANWKNETPEARHAAMMEVRQKAAIMGTYLGALAINQGLLSATDSDQKVNFTNPRRGDWLSFKVAGHNAGVISPMIGTVRFLANVIHDATADRSEFEGMQSSRFQEAAKDAGQYLRGKESPFAKVATDAAFQADFRDKPMPYSTDKISFRAKAQGVREPYTYGEYAAKNFTPIPVQEAVNEIWKAQGMGQDDINAYLRALAIAGIVGGTGARVTEDTSGEYTPKREKN